MVSKVARLKDDGSALGPGAYEVHEASKANSNNVKGGLQWKNVKSQRGEHFIKKYTGQNVGPGKYSPRTLTSDHSI